MSFKYYSYIYNEAYQGSAAPDGDVIELNTGQLGKLLSYAAKSKPLVLNFGSFT